MRPTPPRARPPIISTDLSVTSPSSVALASQVAERWKRLRTSMPAMVIGSKGLAISSSLTQSILLLGRPLPRRGRRHAQDSAYPGAALVSNQADDGKRQ